MDGPEPPLALNGLKKAARRLSRPVRFGRGAPDTAILPYRGYGTAQRFHVTGRVFRQPTFGGACGVLRDAIKRLNFPFFNAPRPKYTLNLH